MDTVGMKSRSKTRKWGWIVLHAINALLILNSAALYVFIATESGEQSAAILLAGLGLYGLALAQDGYRNGSKRAWKAAWITPIILLVLGINITAIGDLSVGVFYLGMAGLALLGQVLAGRELEVSK